MVWVVKEGWDGLTVRFSRIATCPVLRHPNAATARSILPSPLKSAASTLAILRPAIEPERAELPLRQAPHPDDRPFRVIGWEELPHLGDEQILDAVLVDVGNRDVRRVRDAGDLRQDARRRAGVPLKTSPWRMSVPSRSSRPSPSRSISRTCETAGVPGIPGSDSARRVNVIGDGASGPGQDSGAGRRSGARPR